MDDSIEIIINRYQRNLIAIRHMLLGKGWYTALEAMEFALKFHQGKRKDNITPEFYHQVVIAGFLFTLSDGLLYPEETIAVAFLHDCPEDYDIGFEEIESRFGSKIARATKLLTKTHRGRNLSPEAYFSSMAEDPIASVVKGTDRIHNQSTIVGVFSREKQNIYITETNEYIIPMLKVARKNCPKQYNAYRNIMFVLRSQIDMICAVHAALDLTKEMEYKNA